MRLGLGKGITEANPAGVVVSVERNSFTNAKSLDLDGVNDYAKFSTGVNTFNSTLGAGSFSMSWWVKMADVFDAGSIGHMALTYQVAFSPTRLNYLGGIFGPSHGTASYRNKMLFQHSVNGTAYFSTFSTDLSSTLSDDTWFHVVYTSKANASDRTGKIYINGTDVTGTDTSSAVDFSSTTNAEWRIGNYTFNTSPSRYEEMNIDEMTWYDTELSASQVSTIYNGGVPGNRASDANLVGYWRFGDGTGDTSAQAADQSTNSNILRYTGATESSDVPS